MERTYDKIIAMLLHRVYRKRHSNDLYYKNVRFKNKIISYNVVEC